MPGGARVVSGRDDVLPVALVPGEGVGPGEGLGPGEGVASGVLVLGAAMSF